MQNLSSESHTAVRVVIPAIKRGPLDRLLQSLENALQTSIDITVEIVIVDDSRNQVLKGYIDEEKYQLRNGGGNGPGHARNIGARGTEKDSVLAFIDGDCVVSENYFHAVNSLSSDLRRDVLLAGIIKPAIPQGREYLSGKYLRLCEVAGEPLRGEEGEIICAPSGNMLIRSGVFHEVGGFSTAFDAPGGEDDEFCLRLLNSGFSIERAESLVVYHNYNVNIGGLCRKFYTYGRGHEILRRIVGDKQCPYDIPYRSTTDVLRDPVGFFSNIIKKSRRTGIQKGTYCWALLGRFFSLIREISHDIGIIVESKRSGM